jgi:hypothetical protein
MSEFMAVIQFFRDLGVNIPAVFGALIGSRSLITLLNTIFKDKKTVLEYVDKLKTEIPVFISFVICLLFFILGKGSVAEFIAESLLSGFAASFLYATVKRKMDKGGINEN